jgi:hypothetical protein
MCAISGSSDFNKAFNLYEHGLERGIHSSGVLILTKCEAFVFKTPGVFKREELFIDIKNKILNNDIEYLAFHSRAPTNTTLQEWNYDNSHPFNFENYYVAHNGIIDNFKTFPEHPEFIVDSSIIPYHLSLQKGDISKIYEKYTGLLTSWVYDICEHKFNIVKAGSSLYKDENSFCSVSFEGSKRIEEDGLVFCLKDKKIIHENNFKYNNPYFFL